MPLSTLLYVYLLGGITFLPLLIAAILIPAWLLLPVKRDDHHTPHSRRAPEERGPDSSKIDKHDAHHEVDFSGDGSASATFAVLRTYNFPAATAALNSRSSANHVGRGDANDGTTEPSESVYQSMYRSVFDRNKNVNNPMLEREEGDLDMTQSIKRKPISVSVFYIVLRHGHLMLYDSASQLEVRHVISLANHDVSLAEEDPSECLIDGDLFIKRTAIVLTPKSSLSRLTQPATKPFYLFSSTCSEKEDFYFALLAARVPAPIPQAIASADAIKLQSTLHSSILSSETRALNALIGRVFLALHRTSDLEHTIRAKIERKMSRVPKPGFITSLDLTAIDLGDAAPVFSNLRLKDMNITGDTTLSLDVRYNGGIKIVIAAQAKIDLGSRIKARTVDLVLASSLQRLQGHMLIRIKPPPSNRLWFCFDGIPEMDIKVEPVVSQRQITYNFILRVIEERLRAVVAETLVKPNWDDIPFLDTRSQTLRGGIWKDEQLQDAQSKPETSSVAPDPEEPTAARRTSSLPLTSKDDSGIHLSEDASRAAASASSIAWQSTDNLKRRSVTSLPSQTERSASATSEAIPLPRGLRSPSLTMPTPSPPSISIEGATMTSARSTETTTPSKGWRLRASQQLPTKREAVDAVREMRDRAFLHLGSDHAADSLGDVERHDEEILSTVSNDTTSHHARNLSTPSMSSTDEKENDELSHLPRSDTSISTNTTLTRAQQQRKSILAATAAATNAARNWSWNTLANRARAASVSAESVASATAKGQPVGRGQPLPPPGVPLPGPAKSTWASAALGTVRRKPVPPLPLRPGAHSGTNILQDSGATSPVGLIASFEDHIEVEQTNVTKKSEEEFGPWSENSGNRDESARLSNAYSSSTDRLSKDVNGSTSLPTTREVLVVAEGSAKERAFEHSDIPPDREILPSDSLPQRKRAPTASEIQFASGQSTNEEQIEKDIVADSDSNKSLPVHPASAQDLIDLSAKSETREDYVEELSARDVAVSKKVEEGGLGSGTESDVADSLPDQPVFDPEEEKKHNHVLQGRSLGFNGELRDDHVR